MDSVHKWGILAMLNFHFSLSRIQRKALQTKLKRAEQRGDLRTLRRLLALLALDDGHTISEVASLLKVSSEAVRSWLKRFLLHGVGGLTTTKSPGRPPRLTKPQKRELVKLIEEGPAKAGFLGNCWRSPMVQHLIHERFGVFYCVHYIRSGKEVMSP